MKSYRKGIVEEVGKSGNIMMESGFNQETIKNAIHTKWAGKTVHFAEITDSTNLWAKKLVKEESAHGTLVVAEQQTAGRGRLGRKWVSPVGSCVMMSLILRPEFAPQYAPMLTLVMGLSVAQAVRKLGEKISNKNMCESQISEETVTDEFEKDGSINVAIKWPNDVVISGKKICGILTEMELDGTEIRDVVIGVGINVNLSEIEDEIKDVATSLYLETCRKYDRNEIINLVMQQFEINYEKYVQTLDLTYLIEDYNNLLINKDKQVRVLDPKEPFEGIARGINVQGELLVERSDGEVINVGAGEVSVRGLYGYV